MGVNDLVVIHAPEGGYAMDRSRKYYQQESLKLPDGYIKGTVGAGDAFCAGILYSLYKEWDKPCFTDSICRGCLLSFEMNATDGMRDIAGIEELYDTMSRTSQSI